MRTYLSLAAALLIFAVMVGCETDDDPVGPTPDPEVFSTTMTGYQSPEPIASQGWGQANFEVTDAGVEYEVVIQDLFGATQAHIHVGAPGESGPVIAGIFDFGGDAQDIDAETFTGTITEADLMPQEAVNFDGSFDAFLQRLDDGSLYVNAHTVFNPPGEIRGQIASGADNPAPSAPGPSTYTASMDGSTEDVTTDASGEASVTWDWEAREMQYEITLNNIEGVTQGHIHRDETTGPVVAFFSGEVGGNLRYTSSPDGDGEEDQAQTFDGDTISGTIEHAYFTDGFDGSFQQLLQLLRNGEAFINVHTLEYPGGEIGGQFENGDYEGNGDNGDNGENGDNGDNGNGDY